MENKEKNDKIKFSYLIELGMHFQEEPSTDNDIKLQQVMTQLIIAKYLPLYKKETIALKIFTEILVNDSDAVQSAIIITKGLIIYGLLNYIINLDLDIAFNEITEGMIDMLYELGIVDHIIQYCKEDYKRLQYFIDHVVNFYNVNKMLQVPAMISAEKIEEFTQSVGKLKEGLSNNNIEFLKDLIQEGDPLWDIFKDAVTDKVLRDNIDKELNQLQKSEIKDKQSEEENKLFDNKG